MVKTPPSQGGIRGSIPLRAAYGGTSICLAGRSFLFVTGESLAGRSLVNDKINSNNSAECTIVAVFFFTINEKNKKNCTDNIIYY